MARRWGFISLMAVVAIAYWLVLAHPPQIFGSTSGGISGAAGLCLLVLLVVAGSAVLKRLPRDGIETDVSPGEWRAWIGLAFALVIGTYALLHAPLFDGPPWWHNYAAHNVAMMVAVWFILLGMLQTRWKGRAHKDERDREIEARAAAATRIVLVVLAIGLAMMLGYSPIEKLAWASPRMIAHGIVLGLVASSLVEQGYTAIAYWGDRH